MPRNDKFDQELGAALAALQRLADAFARRRAQLARFAGLTEAQYRVLERIAAQDFMPSLFARQQEQTPAAVSKLLRQLLDQGLVVVSISSGDARQRKYALSAHGRQTMQVVRRDRQRAVERIWSGLDARPLADFAAFAQALAQRIEAHEQAETRRKSESRKPQKARRGGLGVRK